MFTTRRLHPRRVPSWEVITSQSVEAAVSPLDFDDAPHRKHSLSTMSAGHTASHLNEAVSDDEHTRTYAFDLPAMHGMPTTDDARRAVRTARERMIAELSRRRSTSPGSRSSSVESGAPLVQLSHERWSFAIMRRESSYRIQVAYFAKINGLAHPEVDQVDPPFLEVIDSRSW
ncbi:hypothetical protein BKA62DRAFT_674029 [Auriculariales sp. MPI-PUGE-AT-0066]|nr:hypothetical protein BKA62DRAFT_674029 [Auriculariales sp. MPI-PUGE-AT-0066]